MDRNHRGASIEALNGCSGTGSGTEQVGSGMNGRPRSGAWFQKRPLSATPYRLLKAALCLVRFRGTQESGQSKRRLPFRSPHGLSMVGDTIRTISNGPGHLLEIGDAPFRAIAYQ